MTIGELYELFDALRPLRRRAAAAILDDRLDVQSEDRWKTECSRRRPCRDARDALSRAHAMLEALPGEHHHREVSVDGRDLRINLDYEFQELERDLVCLDDGMSGLDPLLHVPGRFEEELEALRSLFGSTRYSAVFSDRDGTIANYCGRYRSSHQPFYAAVRVGRFAAERSRDFFIVTSGPLYGHGLLSLSCFPPETVHLAGSKGREFLLADGTTGSFPLTDVQRAAMITLDEMIRALLERPEYRLLTMIGSGYQRKFGQLTVSRQDIHRSVPAEVSESFLRDLRGMVDEFDVGGGRFELDDTGFDIEITLTAEGSQTRGFNKGDGVAFLADSLGHDLRHDPVLVCGDTPSDLPMLEHLAESGYETHAIFVAADGDLERQVRRLATRAVVCSGPDVLVAAMGIAGHAGGHDEFTADEQTRRRDL
ncbi:MAG: hypothetical protein ACOC1I_02505 [Spirochaetota bacterium]